MLSALPDLPTFVAFGAVSLVALLVPGPTVVYVVARSVEQGWRGGLWSMLGLEVGATVHVLAASVGLATLVASSDLAFGLLRWSGAVYLCWLAIREFRSMPPLESELRRPAGARASSMRLFREGVLVDVLNPKTAVFFLAFLPQFVDPSRGATAGQFAVLGMLFVVLAAIVDGAYAVTAARCSRSLRSSSRAQRRVGLLTGGIYLVLAGTVLVF